MSRPVNHNREGQQLVRRAALSAIQHVVNKLRAAFSCWTKMMTPAEPMLLTVPEVAELLRTSPKAIYAMIERERLSGVPRIGRRVLIRRAELRQSLSDHARTSSGGRR